MHVPVSITMIQIAVLVCCSDLPIKKAVGYAGKFIISETVRNIINKDLLVVGIGGVLFGFTVGVTVGFLCGRSGHTTVNNNTIVHNHYTHN